MRYGMNPHQSARVVSEHNPLRPLNGEPSLINYLDSLNAWQLVRSAQATLQAPIAASFKHVSPAGVAVASGLDATACETFGVNSQVSALTAAYIRARDADPKSSFGDVVAISEPVDRELADFLMRVVSDAIVAPAYEPGVVELLARKKQGRFLIFEADITYVPPAIESREVFGMRFEQERDSLPLSADLFKHVEMSVDQVRDGLLALAILRYTQSNSVALVKEGMALGIGAGQQSRVDCVCLAAAKARTWWLRRHPKVRHLPVLDGMNPSERLNWQVRYAEGVMTEVQRREFTRLFGIDAESNSDQEWRNSWVKQLRGVLLGSDGFLPFRDNPDYAADIGVEVIVEPGGSIRTAEVIDAAAELGMQHVQTGIRLFHH